MQSSNVLKGVLLISGLLAAAFGAVILCLPAQLHALNGGELGTEASLLSEIRAPGGALFASGVLMAAGAFAGRLTLTSSVVCALMYSAYGLSRSLSIALDGMPARPLTEAMLAELVLGAVGVFAVRAALRLDRGTVATKPAL